MKKNSVFLFLFILVIMIFSGCVNPIFDDNASVNDDKYLALPNTVKSSTPESGDGGIVAGSNIYIRFYRPMNKKKVEQSFTISPSVAGNFTWPERNVLKFDPDPRLKWDQKYSVQIADTAYDTYGNKIDESYYFTFSTPFESPNVSSYTPQKDEINVNINSNIEIIFSEDMDRTSVYNSFSISPSTQGVFSWDDLKMVFDPNSTLDDNTIYTVKISKGAKDLVGNPLKDDFSFSFTTAPKSELVKPIISYIQPRDNDKIIIYMSEKITQQSGEDISNYSIDGGLIVKSSVLESDQRTITLTTSSQIELKEYKITVSNLNDLAGNTMDTVSMGFIGIDPPDLISINPIDSTKIELIFSETLIKSSAENIHNYFINPFLSITGASLEPVSNSKVVLTVDPATTSQVYTVTVKNVTDSNGVHIESNNTAEFEGIP